MAVSLYCGRPQDSFLDRIWFHGRSLFVQFELSSLPPATDLPV